MQTSKIYIAEPCPVALMRLKKDGTSYHCASCSKTVHDFRDKNSDEILSDTTTDVCGIFYRDQISTVRYSLRRKLLFTALTLLSFIGFRVSPMQAQAADAREIRKAAFAQRANTSRIEKHPVEERVINTPTPSGKRRHFFRRRHMKGKFRYVSIGCPSF